MLKTVQLSVIALCFSFSFLTIAQVQFPATVVVKGSPYKSAMLNLTQDGYLSLTVETNNQHDEIGTAGIISLSGGTSITLYLNGLLPTDGLFPNYVTALFPHHTSRGEMYVITDSLSNAYLIQFENSSSSVETAGWLNKFFAKKNNRTIVRLLAIGEMTPQLGIKLKNGVQPFESVVDSLVTTSRCETWLMNSK